MKPKTNRAGSLVASSPFDRCQTPPYALTPLLPYLADSVVWEPASGDGVLARALMPHCRKVIATDVLQGFNYFDTPAPDQVTRIVTNPPYSIKREWLYRTLEFDIPWALLMPVECLGVKGMQEVFRQGVEVIFLDHRVNFKMPNKRKWRGSSAQFPVCWFTRGLGIGRENTFAQIEVVYPDDDPGPDPCDHHWIEHPESALLICMDCGLQHSDFAVWRNFEDRIRARLHETS